MGFSRGQLALLLTARCVEPIGYTILLPFLNTMIEGLLVDTPPSRVGRFSGAMQSLFALSTIVFMYHWGRLSDRIGRKPVILCGLSGVAFCFTMLGLSRNIWWALGVRSLAGALCGNASVMRAALGDMTPPDKEGWVYPLWSICWDVSCVIGPAIGALLQDPAAQYPDSYFGRSDFFKQYPFFLPLSFVSVLAVCASFVILVFFRETNPRQYVEEGGEESAPLLKSQTGPESVSSLIAIPEVRSVLISAFLLTLVAMSFDAGFVLFCYSPIPLSGLGLVPGTIATLLSIKGAVSIFLSLIVLPRLRRRFGVGALFPTFAAAWIAAYALLPIMHSFARVGSSYWVKDGHLRHLWIVMSLDILFYVLGDFCFPLQMMALNRTAPSKTSLGRLNAISLVASALGKTSGSSLIGTLFGYSAEIHFPVVWVVFGIFAVICTLQSRIVARFDRKKEESGA